MFKKYLAAIWIFSFLSGCEQKKAPNHFSDPLLLKIADYQDHRFSDSLYRFLISPEPKYRAAAALAFGSIQDTAASQLLGNLLLEDTVALVRMNAAFALGQTGGAAAVNALIPAADDKDGAVVREVLEALGKTVSGDDIKVLSRRAAKDSMSQEGLAWGLYRLALRNKTDTLMVALENRYLSPSFTTPTRLAAAHFFNQSAVPGGVFEKNLIEAALHDPSPEVRIAAAAALRKVKDESALGALRKILANEKDYRVRISVARSLQSFPIEEIWDLLVIALHDPHPAVAVAASEIVPIVLREGDDRVLAEARSAKNVRVQANLFEAIFAAGPYSKEAVEEVKQKFIHSINPYERAQWMGALSAVTAAYRFIGEAILQDTTHVVRTSAALALSDINSREKLTPVLKKELAELYKKAIGQGDPAVIAIVSETLSNPVLGYRAIVPNIDFLREARIKLQLPRDIEALQPLENAIAYFEGKEKPAPLKNAFNHPIDWKFVAGIEANQRVLVRTNRGEIILKLLVEESPGSVANFINLINAHYFDGRYYHRVVPNFVIQTGCNRGDGFGSEDYSIRSEYSRRRYSTGSVGMASAGKDTEGTQWFITHSPTPHLSGRYTIFAEVVKGMDIVDNIEVGDQNTSVVLIQN